MQADEVIAQAQAQALALQQQGSLFTEVGGKVQSMAQRFPVVRTPAPPSPTHPNLASGLKLRGKLIFGWGVGLAGQPAAHSNSTEKVTRHDHIVCSSHRLLYIPPPLLDIQVRMGDGCNNCLHFPSFLL